LRISYIIILFLGLGLFFGINSIFADQNDTKSVNMTEEIESNEDKTSEGFDGKPIIHISTKTDRVLEGSLIMITGKVFNELGEPKNVKISLNVVNDDTDKSVYHQTFMSENGQFRHNSLELRQSGDYTIYANATINNNVQEVFLPIQVKSFPSTGVGIGIFAEIFFLAALLTLIYAQLRHGWSIPSVEPFRFALLTLCSVIPIIIFISADVELGQDSPFGFVVMHTTEPVGEMKLKQILQSTFEVEQNQGFSDKFQWIINVGGNPRNNYSEGIQIPIFVLVFGLIGGYLRFLRKTSKGWIKDAVMESMKIFESTNADGSKKTVSNLLENRYYITIPSGEIFDRKMVCHICNMRKDFIQKEGEPICPECYRKRTKSCVYCKMDTNKKIKEMELELMEVEKQLEKNKIEQKKNEDERRENKNDGNLDKKIEKLKETTEKLEHERQKLKVDLEPLYIDRATELRWDKKCAECKKKNLDNKHIFLSWKNNSKLQRRFYPEIKRAIFNNSMEDLALIFLPPVLAFALYFVLLQAGINAQDDMPTIAAVSLAVGLITKEALQRLESVGKSILLGTTKKKKNEEDENDSQESKEKTTLEESKTESISEKQ